MDIFTEEFKQILADITPAMLVTFDTNTIQLLLELVYSYLSHETQEEV